MSEVKSTKGRCRRQQRERREQQYVVQWFAYQYPNVKMAASANGGKRDPITAANLKKDGVLAGVPDLQVFRASRGFHGLFIEMKAPDDKRGPKGVLSEHQKQMLDYLNGEGYYAVACWGFLEAKKVIQWYLQ